MNIIMSINHIILTAITLTAIVRVIIMIITVVNRLHCFPVPRTVPHFQHI